ncbi:MAG: hypothetical protein M1828_001752 [Chrysothrix sp. TS-e1954]|nr:MAG: hypothetical protein M1828_001752 [Chrysothrix sp. TS-e1954]
MIQARGTPRARKGRPNTRNETASANNSRGRNLPPRGQPRAHSALSKGDSVQRAKLQQQHGESRSGLPGSDGPAASFQRRSNLGEARLDRTDFQQRYQLLKKRREQERFEAIRDGFLADPDRPRTLAEAITLVGTCEDMCPEYERLERIIQKDVWPVELVKQSKQGSGVRPPADEARMVKKFRRAAAGIDEQLPSDLRPPPVLKRAVDYLMNDLVESSACLGDVHHFVWDRTRAIRNDFSIQQVRKGFDLLSAVDCYERIARFHILSLHILAEDVMPYQSYDVQQEREQLDKTLLSLMQYYDDSRGRHDHANEAEFRAYCIIFQIQDPTPDLEDRVQHWPKRIRTDRRVTHALQLYVAACNTIDTQGPFKPRASQAIAQADWQKFWHVLKSKQVSYLMACVAETYFTLNRRIAINAIWNGYRQGAGRSTQDWSFAELLNVFAFDGLDEVSHFCETYGFATAVRDGIEYLDIESVNGRALPDPFIKQRFSMLVEKKKCRRRLCAIINGLSVRQASQSDLITEQIESSTHGKSKDTEPSLFVSDESDSEPVSRESQGSNSGQGKVFVETASAPNALAASSTSSSTASIGNAASANQVFKPFFAGSSTGKDNTWKPSGIIQFGSQLSQPQQQHQPSQTTTPSTLPVTGNKSSLPQFPFNSMDDPPRSSEDIDKRSRPNFNPNATLPFSTGEGVVSATPPTSFDVQQVPNGPGDGTPSRLESWGENAPLTAMPYSDEAPVQNPTPATASLFSKLNKPKKSSPLRSESTDTGATSSLNSLIFPLTTGQAVDPVVKTPVAPTPASLIPLSKTPHLIQPSVGGKIADNPLYHKPRIEPTHHQASISLHSRHTDQKPLEFKHTEFSGSRLAPSSGGTTNQVDGLAQLAKPPVEERLSSLERLNAIRSGVFKQLARSMMLEPYGFLDQYIEYSASQIIMTTQTRLAEERLVEKANLFRLRKIMCRFGNRWREVCLKRRLARQGKERRRRHLKGVQAKTQEERASSIYAERNAFRRSLSSSRSSSTGTAPARGHEDNNTSFCRGLQDNDAQSLQLLPDMQHDRESTLTTHEDMPKLQHSLMRSTATSMKRPSHLRFSQSVDDSNSFDRGRMSAQGQRRNTTRSTYFRMKAMGLDSRNISKIYVSPQKTDRKRPRDSGSDLGDDMPSKRWHTMSSATKGAAETPSHTRAPEDGNLSQPTRLTAGPHFPQDRQHDDDEALFAAARQARQAMSESMSLFSAEIANEEFRASASAMRSLGALHSTPVVSSMTSNDIISSNSTPRLSPPKYRSRVSRFLSRDQYADRIFAQAKEKGLDPKAFAESHRPKHIMNHAQVDHSRLENDDLHKRPDVVELRAKPNGIPLKHEKAARANHNSFSLLDDASSPPHALHGDVDEALSVSLSNRDDMSVASNEKLVASDVDIEQAAQFEDSEEDEGQDGDEDDSEKEFDEGQDGDEDDSEKEFDEEAEESNATISTWYGKAGTSKEEAIEL